jgi:hypothetical protein
MEKIEEPNKNGGERKVGVMSSTRPQEPKNVRVGADRIPWLSLVTTHAARLDSHVPLNKPAAKGVALRRLKWAGRTGFSATSGQIPASRVYCGEMSCRTKLTEKNV